MGGHRTMNDGEVWQQLHDLWEKVRELEKKIEEKK